MAKTEMKSTLTPEQWRYLLNEEAAGRFGKQGLGPLAQWLADNRHLVAGMLNGSVKPPKFPCQIYAPELIPQGWKVIEDVEPVNLMASKIEPFSPWKRSEELSSQLIWELANTHQCAYSLSDAKQVLRDIGHLNERKWVGWHMTFTRTILRDTEGKRRYPYINHVGEKYGGWQVVLGWLDHDDLGSCALPQVKPA